MADNDTSGLETALVNADKAGDKEAATALAHEITRRRTASAEVVSAASMPGMAKSDSLSPLDEEGRYKALNQTVLRDRLGGRDVQQGWGGIKKGYVQAFAPDKAKGDVSEKTLHGIIAAQHDSREGKVLDDSYKDKWMSAVASGDHMAALRVYGDYFSHPWKRYEESVEQAFEPSSLLPKIPQVSQPRGLPPGAQEAGETGANLVNAASGIAGARPIRSR